MKILLTNNTLGDAQGSENYVRDIAVGLQDRGHSAVVYSSRLGQVAEALRAATVPVVEDLTKCPWRPDVIHGHHHLETMAAMMNFPGVPAVSVCHGWIAWEENPPHYPRIHRYIAVDQVCRDRLVFEHGLSEDRVEIMLNFVDLNKFQPRAPLPPRPQRALMFSNYAREGPMLAALRAACARTGMSLDGMGKSMGSLNPHPEVALRGYDVVFAKARCALEALAVGTAVIVLDVMGMNEMVSTSNFDALRPLNFGIRTQRYPISVDRVVAEIERYDAADAAAVSRIIRETAGREAAIDRYLRLYEEAIRESRPADLEAEVRAAGAYVQWLLPRFKEYYNLLLERPGLQRENDSLKAKLAAAEAELQRTRSR